MSFIYQLPQLPKLSQLPVLAYDGLAILAKKIGSAALYPFKALAACLRDDFTKTLASHCFSYSEIAEETTPSLATTTATNSPETSEGPQSTDSEDPWKNGQFFIAGGDDDEPVDPLMAPTSGESKPSAAPINTADKFYPLTIDMEKGMQQGYKIDPKKSGGPIVATAIPLTNEEKLRLARIKLAQEVTERAEAEAKKALSITMTYHSPTTAEKEHAHKIAQTNNQSKWSVSYEEDYRKELDALHPDTDPEHQEKVLEENNPAPDYTETDNILCVNKPMFRPRTFASTNVLTAAHRE